LIFGATNYTTKIGELCKIHLSSTSSTDFL